MSSASLFKRMNLDGRFLGKKQVQQVQPPRLSDPVRFPYGAFQFKISSAPNVELEIQVSADFKSWTHVETTTSKGEVTEFLDSSASKFNHRFYRVMAGEIRSANVLGYVTVTIPPGFSMIANPLNAPSNEVPKLFKGLPEGTVVSKFNTRMFGLDENILRNERWTNSYETLAPGEGAILFNPTQDYKSLNFVGEVMEDEISLPIPAGFSIRSALVPLPGRVHEDLGFPISEGDVVHLYDTNKQQYVLYPYTDKEKWAANPPLVNAGESFWIEKTSPKTWIRQSLR